MRRSRGPMTIQRSSEQRCFIVACVFPVVLASLASGANAQTETSVDWHRGTTLGAFVGAASASSDTDASAGLSLGWEITPRFGVEGRGLWFLAGSDQDGFAATLAGRFALQPARPLVPFVTAGVGMYLASFEASAANVPDFYRTRLTSAGLPETFTDFMLSFGGGVEMFVTRHFALRPEVNVLLVTSESSARAVAVYGAQLTYHFEDHVITPARNTR